MSGYGRFQQHLELCSSYGCASIIVSLFVKCWVQEVLPLIVVVQSVIKELSHSFIFLESVPLLNLSGVNWEYPLSVNAPLSKSP